ncbi:hypothetical protein B9479_003051 [Cryptococcus floricola]|uniref:Uncharacterized protein n=1 Tax=Cryptococcus floricola TaxID=2591691 RepID=A0A5D3AXM1_9TREE|nr:hypothetical protein B9479_003051 [Cryptococcus floricola]
MSEGQRDFHQRGISASRRFSGASNTSRGGDRTPPHSFFVGLPANPRSTTPAARSVESVNTIADPAWDYPHGSRRQSAQSGLRGGNRTPPHSMSPRSTRSLRHVQSPTSPAGQLQAASRRPLLPHQQRSYASDMTGVSVGMGDLSASQRRPNSTNYLPPQEVHIGGRDFSRRDKALTLLEKMTLSQVKEEAERTLQMEAQPAAGAHLVAPGRQLEKSGMQVLAPYNGELR